MKTTRNTSSGISCKRRWQTGKRTIIGPSGIVLFIMILFWILGGQNSFAQGVGISESSIVPHSSSILELRSTLRGFLAPRMTTSQRVILGSSSPAQGLLVYDTNTRSFWYYDGGWKVVRGSGTLGGSNQLLGMNAAGDENEYKTLNGSINILVTHSTGNINLTTSQDIYPAATPTFAGLKISSLAINSGVYTDGFSFLTTAPPPNGILGYWSRSGNILSPATPGDFVTTSGNIYTTGPGTITSAGLLTGFAGASISGGPINLNNNSSFSTNINTGNSAGAIIIGNPANTITLPAFASAGVVHNAFGGLLSSSLIINPDIANGTIDLLNKVTNTLKVVNGGTGLVTFGGTNTVLYTSATDVLTSVATSTAAGQFLQTSTTGSAPTWKTILDVVNGGTNSGTALNNNRFMISNGGKIEEAGAMLNGQVIVGSTGLAPQIVTMSGEATIDNAGTLALSTTGVAFGTYGDATHVGRFTVDSKGRLTAANDVLITGTSPIGSSLTSANIWVGNTSNQAAEVLMSGDATMTNTGAVTVGRINGATVPVSGALVTGNVLQVIGSNSTTYGPVNVGGGLDYVTGTLPVVNGGTGQSSPLIPGGVLYGSTATAAGVTSAGLTGQMLRSAGSGTPIWSTPTYPNSATFGKIMIGNGTNWLESLTTYPSTTTANQLLYSSANNTITGLATANNGVLVTDGTGAPSISSTLPNAVQGNITSVGTLTNLTVTNIIVGSVTGNAGTATILQTGRAINGVTFNGSADITVPVNSTDDLATVTTVYPLWTTAVGNTAAKLSTSKLSFVPSTGILTATGFAGSGAGLTNIPNTSLSNNSLTIGTTNIALGATSTILAGLTSVTSTSFTGALTGNAGTATALANARLIYGNSFNGTADLAQVITSTYGGTGNGFAKLTGPTTAEKTFILPDASSTILTSNSAVTVAQGGTGATTKTTAFDALSPMSTEGDIIYGGASGTATRLPAGTTGYVLGMGATTPQWQAAGAGNMILAAVQTVSGAKTFLSDVTIDATGSSSGAPRTVGIIPMPNNTFARFAFGDDHNVLQNGYGQRMQLTAYWGVDISGNTGLSTASLFIGGDPGDASLNVIGTRGTNTILAVGPTSTTSQTGNLQEWRNSGGTALASVSSTGKISTSGGATINGAFNYGVDASGGGNAFSISLSPAPTTYIAGMMVIFKAGNSNSGACTMEVNGLGTKNILIDDNSGVLVTPGANVIDANGVYILVYDGTQFVLIR